MTDLTQGLTLVLLGALIIIAGLALIDFLSSHRSTNPTIAAMEEALTKYVYTGILAGEKLVLQGEQTVDNAVVNANRAAVAQAVWDALPSSVAIAGQSVSIETIKRVVGADRWQALVKSAYDQAHAFILQNENYLTKQITITQTKQEAK